VTAPQAAQAAGTAKDEAAQTAQEGVQQVKDLASTVKDQLGTQIGSSSEKLTGSLRSLSTQLKEGDTSGVLGQVMSEAAERLQKLADHVESTGPQGLLEDLRSFARRTPGSFLLSALAGGVVAGRATKGLSGGGSAGASANGVSSTGLSNTDQFGAVQATGMAPVAPIPAAGTAAGDPLAGITTDPGTGTAAGYPTSPELGETYTPEPGAVYPETAAPLSSYDSGLPR
jgi:hypothetical protein